MLNDGCLNLQLGELERYQRFDLVDYGIRWQIPEIEHRVIVLLGLKKCLDEARGEYEELLDSFQPGSEIQWEMDRQQFDRETEEDYWAGIEAHGIYFRAFSGEEGVSQHPNHGSEQDQHSHSMADSRN